MPDDRAESPAQIPAQLPRRPVLRPGLHVVRRDDRHLQVGVDPPEVLVAADEPGTRRFLEDLRTGVPPASHSPALGRLLTDLVARGLVVDAGDLDAAMRGTADRTAVAAAYAQFGPDAGRRLAARADVRIAIDAPHDVGQAAARLLRASGVGLATPQQPADDPARTAAATSVLLVSDTVLPRERLDPVVRSGLPHLVVLPGPGGLQVGPFVVPGVTACLRCVDARLAERDPGRPLLLEQCGPATASAGPVPRDPALVALAVGLAARDLVAFADGDRPATWSASLTVGHDLSPTLREWRRHPHCGCSWDALLAV